MWKSAAPSLAIALQGFGVGACGTAPAPRELDATADAATGDVATRDVYLEAASDASVDGDSAGFTDGGIVVPFPDPLPTCTRNGARPTRRYLRGAGPGFGYLLIRCFENSDDPFAFTRAYDYEAIYFEVRTERSTYVARAADIDSYQNTQHNWRDVLHAMVGEIEVSWSARSNEVDGDSVVQVRRRGASDASVDGSVGGEILVEGWGEDEMVDGPI